MSEQEEIDRLTARLRGHETNREYWTRISASQPPFTADEYITGQVALISRHIQMQPGEILSPSLVIELWRACWTGLNLGGWQSYSQGRGEAFGRWVDMPHRTDAGNEAVYKSNYKNGHAQAAKNLKTHL